jgi:flagellin
MPQVINTNIASLNAQRNLNASQGDANVALQRLSSGLRINSAKDDAAGLAISERFTSQITGLNQAIRNANDGISFSQVAEGALAETTNSLQRIRELAVQSANDTNSASDRQALNQEVSALIAEVNRIAATTQFNGRNILDGSLEDFSFQVGANANQAILVDGVDGRGNKLGAEVFEGTSINRDDLALYNDADDLQLNGVNVDLTSASTIQDVINEVNKSTPSSGVRAEKLDSASVLSDFTTAAANSTITINGVNIDILTADTAQTVAEKINKVSGQTGVAAEFDATPALTLSSENGSSIEITDTASILDDVVDTEQTFDPGLKLISELDQEISISGTGDGDVTNPFATIGLGNGTAINLATTQFVVSDMNVLTRDESTNTIITVDYALERISSLRSELGAVQNRFDTTISNLSTATENLSAARSRIQDADFAAESAELARTQVLQQAGLSVLAQANARPQQVLQLLQG